MVSEKSEPSWWATHGNTAGLVGLVGVAVLGFLVCPSSDEGSESDAVAKTASAKTAPAGGVAPNGDGDADAAQTAAAADGAAQTAAAADGAGAGAGGNGHSAEANPDGDPEAAADAQSEPEGAAADGAADEDSVVEIEDRSDVPAEATPVAEPDAGGVADTAADADVDAAPSTIKPVDRTGESKLTAEELYAAAKVAYGKREYREAFRLASKSQHAKPDDTTQALRGRAACQIKDRAAAKKIIKSFKLRDSKRKELRSFCKERGVNVVL